MSAAQCLEQSNHYPKIGSSNSATTGTGGKTCLIKLDEYDLKGKDKAEPCMFLGVNLSFLALLNLAEPLFYSYFGELLSQRYNTKFVVYGCEGKDETEPFMFL